MNFFYALKKILFSSMCMYACFTWSVYAEESTLAAEQVIEPTPQQPLTDPDADADAEPVTDHQRDTDVEKPTPQPPLIDPESKQTYEPPPPETSTVGIPITEKEDEVVEQRSIGNTPQPPIIDKKIEPNYVIKETDISTDKENIAPASETDKTSLQAPAADQAIEPENKAVATDTITKDQVDTDKESDEVSTEQAEAKKEQAKKWTETYPVSVNADWLQLKSGEWLRGEITILQKDVLEFESDELDNLVIKWKNVKYLKSYGPYSLRFDSQDRVSVTGAIEVIGDKVYVTTDYDDQVYDRSDLQTIASGKETEISFWKSKVTISINIRKGNTDQTDFTSKMTAKRRTTNSRLVLDYLGNFTQVQEIETINNHRLNETYDFFLSRDLFWTVIFSEFYSDPFQNIDQRMTVGTGIGYSIINTIKTDWDVSAGPAYQSTKFDSVLPGVDQTDSTAALVLGTAFNTELNSFVDLEGLYRVTLGDKETGNYTHHSLLTIETEITDKLDFDVTAVWDHVSKPVADQHGITPEPDDFRLMVGLGYDL